MQLIVIGSEFDFFWKFLDVDELKRTWQGKGMEYDREAKDAFIYKIMHSPQFQKLDHTRGGKNGV